jgi:hypothetical protein
MLNLAFFFLHDSRVLLVLANIRLAPCPHRIMWQHILPYFVFVVSVFISASAKKIWNQMWNHSVSFFLLRFHECTVPFVVQWNWLNNVAEIGDRLLRNNIFLFTMTLESNFFCPSDEVSSVPIIYHLLGMLLAKPNSTPGISTPENGIAKNSPMTNLWCH